MKKQKPNLAFKAIIILAALLLLVGAAAVYSRKVLTTSDYFTIKEIISKDEPALELSYLKGRNIFTLDLAGEARYIAEAYPLYRKIRLVRVLPNRIYVSAVKRAPVAYVRLYRVFCVDEVGMLFDEPQGQERDLPVIAGLETKIFGPRAGRIYNVRELALALEIIKEFNKNKALADWTLKKVDVSNPGSAFFIILDNLEVRVGQDDIAEKIRILPGLLLQVKPDPSSIKYIDLRFKDPVIRLKDSK